MTAAAISFAKDDAVMLRPGEPTDAAFILKTWLTTYGNNSRFAEVMGEAYWPEHRLVIIDILSRANVMVAASSAAPETIIGFVVTEERDGIVLLHWLQIRKEFWRNGIARRLVEPLIDRNVICTHRTKAHPKLPPLWRFDLYKGLR